MRESIGTAFMLNFIILFIFLTFAFLAGTLSYYKAYKINNYMTNAIERFNGYNQYSADEISKGLRNIGYENAAKIDCKAVYENSSLDYMSSTEYADFNPTGYLVNENNQYVNSVDTGYCVYLYDPDLSYKSKTGGAATTDPYYSYGILTYMNLRFPVIENYLHIPIFTRTNKMYKFN